MRSTPQNTILNYYPFGSVIKSRAFASGGYRFGYGGHERDNEIKGSGNHYNMGARLYDPRIGRTPTLDPMRAMYPDISPYAYAANNPTNAIDPDGRVVIFINGLWGAGTGASGGGTISHWGAGWISRAQNRIGDHKAIFYDGSADWRYKKGGTSRLSWNFDYKNRIQAGYLKGKVDAADIVNSLEKDEHGNMTESIKFVTSSMGAAFSRGMSKAIMQYVEKENQKIDKYNASLQRDECGNACDPSQLKKRLNVVIEFTVDLDPFQGAAVGADPNSQDNYYMKKEGSWATGKVPGSTEIGTNAMEGHHPSWAPTDKLPQGTMNPKGKSTQENPSE
jgi:RHS repeat-associated protein